MKYFSKFAIVLLCSLLLSGCKNPSEKLTNSVIWIQNSAEYRACCYQAFNYGKLVVEKNLVNIDTTKPLAVVFDLDETLLDNSFYQAELILKKTEFYKYNQKYDTLKKGVDTTKIEWKHNWTLLKKTKAVPGAIDFIKFLDSLNINVIYISNRENDEKFATIENMDSLKFPKIDTANYLFCEVDGKSSKEARRKTICEKYNVILFVGDNLADLDDKFEGRKNNEPNKFKEVDDSKNDFGTKYIIFPNPMYGKWEDNTKCRLIGIDNIK